MTIAKVTPFSRVTVSIEADSNFSFSYYPFNYLKKLPRKKKKRLPPNFLLLFSTSKSQITIQINLNSKILLLSSFTIYKTWTAHASCARTSIYLHTHIYKLREREREYPNKALEAKGVPAAMEAAAVEAARVAENKPVECRVWLLLQLRFFLSRSKAIAIPAIVWISTY